MTDLQVYSDAAILGGVGGIRSMSPPAIISHLAEDGSLPADNTPMLWLAHSGVAKTTAALAFGEAVADKFPIVPSRTEPGSLVTRAISGAMAGAALASGRDRPVLFGAIIGASAAVAATFAVTNLRRFAKERTGVPDFVFGLAEDGLVIAAALHVFSSERSVKSTT